MITSLLEIGERWRSNQYTLRQEAIVSAAPQFCLSPANFNIALDWMFSFWNKKTILKLQKHRDSFGSIKHAVQILAGNTPALFAQVFLQGAILQVPQIIKIPSEQWIFAELILRSFKEIDSQLADLFTIDTWKDNVADLYKQINATDWVIAYGSDETMQVIKNHCGSHTLFLPQGHAVSCALVSKDGITRNHLEKLALDMLVYDQRGCLSPRAVFIQEGGVLSAKECAAIFAHEILPKVAKEIPRGGLFPGEAAAIMQHRALAGFRGDLYQGDDWTVTYDDVAQWPVESLPRFLPFKKFDDMTDLKEILDPIRSQIISLGVAGNISIEELGCNHLRHIAELGFMQKQFLYF